MNTTALSAAIARRLPQFSRRDIREVLEVLTELCYAELGQHDGEIHLAGLGKLYVETHRVKVSGVMAEVLRQKHGRQAPETLLRHTVRFRASAMLRVALNGKAEHRQEALDA